MENKDFIKIKTPDGEIIYLDTDITYQEKYDIVESLTDKYSDQIKDPKSWDTLATRYFVENLTNYLLFDKTRDIEKNNKEGN